MAIQYILGVVSIVINFLRFVLQATVWTILVTILNIALRDSINLSLDSKFLPAFCEFQYQLCFQNLHCALLICPC